MPDRSAGWHWEVLSKKPSLRPQHISDFDHHNRKNDQPHDKVSNVNVRHHDRWEAAIDAACPNPHEEPATFFVAIRNAPRGWIFGERQCLIVWYRFRHAERYGNV